MLESAAAAAEKAKEDLEEVRQAVSKEGDVKEEAPDVTETVKLQLKGLKEEVADVPAVVETALQGEAKQPTCNLFAMCGA